MKGQGSTEYLVILAVVLVVALIVIGLLGGFTGFGVSGAESQSQAYWRGASPFSIQTAMVNAAGVQLEVQSKSSEQLTLSSLTFDGAELMNSTQKFAPGGSKKISANASVFNCTSGQTQYEVTTVRFLYTVGAINQIQQGDKALAGKCS